MHYITDIVRGEILWSEDKAISACFPSTDVCYRQQAGQLWGSRADANRHIAVIGPAFQTSPFEHCYNFILRHRQCTGQAVHRKEM